MTARPTFSIPPHVLYREVDGELVLLDLDSERYYGLNQVGARIVTLVTEQPFEGAIERLLDDFDVDPVVLRRDMDNLIQDLERAGLLKRT